MAISRQIQAEEDEEEEEKEETGEEGATVGTSEETMRVEKNNGGL